MMGFLRAHGVDPGPLQRPILAGLLSGTLAAAPALTALVGFGSFAVAAEEVIRTAEPAAALLIAGSFTASGALYALLFRRAANDRRGGWLFGLAFGFALWMAAPVIALPLMGDGAIAAGRAAVGFLASFLVWGLVLGAAFPLIHRPLHQKLGVSNSGFRREGAGAATKLLRRTPRRWR